MKLKKGKAVNNTIDDFYPKAEQETVSLENELNIREANDQEYSKIPGITFPIPIRNNTIVKVAGIPNDLTPDEAKKIANVILALFGSQE